MKIYTWLFLILSLAQLVFAVTWLFFIKKIDRVFLLSFLIYAGTMIIGYISCEVEKYRRRRKELLEEFMHDE